MAAFHVRVAPHGLRATCTLRPGTPDGGRTSGIFTGTSAERADTFPAPSTAATEYEYVTPGWPVLSMVCVVVTDLITLAPR